ncbi:MAG: hypothetical protein ACR2QB_04475 [Gammaproteobacteria bacterium]
MMRTSHQPLAHLVDAAAQKWLAAAQLTANQQSILHTEITQAFRIGDNPRLTFHGLRYLMTIARETGNNEIGPDAELRIHVHEIALHD